jgi:regulation of enolase protein 1 (concanavalin A-like superfamily)
MRHRRCHKLLAITLFVSIAVIAGDPVGRAQGTSPATIKIVRNASLWQDVWPGDFNGDGITDLAGSDRPVWNGGTGRVLVVIGNGAGGFGAPIVTGFTGHVLTTADFNADGKRDLVVIDDNNTAVAILPGNGNGTFGAPRTVETLRDITFAVSADFDGDGKRDLVIGAGPSQARIYHGNGNFTFETPVSLTTGAFPHDAIIADLNRDNKPDLVVANHYTFNISVFVNQGALTFTAADITVGGSANDVTAADLNGDGKIDLVVATARGGDLDFFSEEGHAEVLLGHGDGTFDPPVQYDTPRGAWQVVVGDFTRDRIIDIATANRSSVYRDDCTSVLKTWDTVSILPGAGNGTFGPAQSFSIGDQNADRLGPDDAKFRNTVRTLNTSDLNRDGATDLIASWGVLLLNMPAHANVPPVANAGPDQTWRNTGEGVLSGRGSDPDEDMLSWLWTDEQGLAVNDVPTTCISGLAPGAHVFTLTVSDGHGHQASDSVTITRIDDDTGGGTIAISAPVAGALVAGGQPYTIRWTAPATLGSEHVRVSSTVNGGGTWTEIAECRNTLVSAGECVWQNPGPDSDQAFISMATTDGNVPGSGATGRFTIRAASGSLPPPWQHADVGAVGAAGSAVVVNDVFTIAGSGADIWGTADEFHYVYQTRSGAGGVDAVTLVNSVQNVNPWTKAGLMLRANLNAGAAHASIFITPGRGVSFQRRVTANGTSVSTTTAGITVPVWLRLASQGTTVIAYYKQNASDAWIRLGEQTFTTNFADVGLAVTSHADGTTASASFPSVAVTPSPTWTTSLIGTSIGSATMSGGTFTLTNRGADIWNTADQFTFVSTPWSGNGAIEAKVQRVDNTYPWAKAGVMFRNSVSANSAHVSVFVTPGQGVAMQYRAAAGGVSASVAKTAAAAPAWVRLRRSANTFTGEWSNDGVTWKVLGTVGVTMAADVRAGVALTSHNTTTTGSAVFVNPVVSP